jgi:molybdate transport system ATP-binding protein
MLLMSKGSFVAQGPVRDILARLDLPPLTGRFEAGVVLDGKVAAHDQHYALTTVDIGDGAMRSA